MNKLQTFTANGGTLQQISKATKSSNTIQRGAFQEVQSTFQHNHKKCLLKTVSCIGLLHCLEVNLINIKK